MFASVASSRALLRRRNSRPFSLWKKIDYLLSPKLEIEPVVLLAHDSQQFENYIESITTHSDQEYGGESMINYSFVSEPSLQAFQLTGAFNFAAHHIKEKKSKEQRVAVRGYCAVNVKFKEFQDLNDHVGLELVLRSQYKQNITLNFSAGYFQNTELFQIPIVIPGGNKFIRIYLPFHYFKVKENNTQIDFQNDNLKLNGLGFLITQPSEDSDNFNIAIQSITAVSEMPRNSVPLPEQNDVVSRELRRMTAEREARRKDALIASEALLARTQEGAHDDDVVVDSGEGGMTSSSSSNVTMDGHRHSGIDTDNTDNSSGKQ